MGQNKPETKSQVTDFAVTESNSPKSLPTASMNPLLEAESSQDSAHTFHSPSERFEHRKVLGEGHFGKVFLAYDIDIKREIAIKRLKALRHDAEAFSRFIKEVEITGQLDHQNITSLHDVGISSEGEYYFIMKYEAGQTLREIISSLRSGDPETHRAYPFAVRLGLFSQILQAIHFAHSKGIIHRDIKPENILVGEFGEVTVMDWGIAKVISQEQHTKTIENQHSNLMPEVLKEADPFVTQEKSILGTLAYMAPEQAQGKNSKLDKRCDVYSLCAVLYELLSLRHYIEQSLSSNLVLWLGVLQEEPVPIGKLTDPSGIQGRPPLEFLYFAYKGLNKKREERFESVEQMIQEFQSIQDGNIPVKCLATLGKNVASHFQRFSNNKIPQMILVVLLVFFLNCLGLMQIYQWLFS